MESINAIYSGKLQLIFRGDSLCLLYEKSKKKLSNASRSSTKAAFNNCKKLHDRKFVDLRKADLQDVIDTCPLKHSSLELIEKSVYGHRTIEQLKTEIEKIRVPDVR